MSFVSRRRALIAAPVTAALVIVGVGVTAAPAWASDPITNFSELSDAVAAGGTVTLTQDLSLGTQDLQVPGGTVVTLDLASSDLTLRQFTLGATSNVTITDSGSSDPGVLMVSSNNYNEGGIRTSGATLHIDGQVHVTANGGDSVAGIGGADQTSSGTVIIGGDAVVTAHGGAHAAGIGGGNGGGGAPTIQGDAVVNATGGNGGAGLGGGERIGGGATIGGNAVVTAVGGSGASGIGPGIPVNVPGSGSGVSAVDISDTATVTATGGAGGSGIGAIGTGGIGTIVVSDSATVTATGFGVGVGIGAGFGPGGTLTFEDSSVVTAVGGSQAWGIGTGTAAHTASISIDDSAHVKPYGALGSIGSSDDAFGEVIVDGELEIPAGKTLTLPSGSDYVSGDGTLSGAGTVVNNGSIALPDSQVTVATVNVHNYQVSFVGNGGVLTPAGPIRVLATTFVQANRAFPTGARNGFLLDGWKEGADAFDGFSQMSGATTLTAQWKDYAATLPTPVITGQAKVGTGLTADPLEPGWADGTTFSYTWLRDGVAISPDDHDQYYTVQGADLGKQISVRVTGTNAGQPTLSKTSAKTAKVVSGAITGLSGVIGGDYLVGGTYTSSASSSVATATYSYQWYVDGTAVSNATTANWVATSAALNRTVSVKITAKATGYTSATILVLSDTPTGYGQFGTPPTPVITGTEQTGHKLTAVPGTWAPKAKFTYQWFRDGFPVVGATSSTLTLPANGRGSYWQVRVTGSLSGYQSRVTYSAYTGAILGTLSGATPKITGTVAVGRTLTAVPGTWTAGTAFDYQWMRISSTGSSTSILGATDPTYTLQAADKGKTIKVRVTGVQSGYANLAKLSAATKKVP
jgi:hypothetical protein